MRLARASAPSALIEHFAYLRDTACNLYPEHPTDFRWVLLN